MAYKDEYEVTRLMQHPDGLATAMIQKLCVSERIADDTERLAVAIDLAELPDMIRGYEELKVARVSEYRMLAQQKLAWLRGPRA